MLYPNGHTKYIQRAFRRFPRSRIKRLSMRYMTAQEFVKLISETFPTSYAVAQYDHFFNRDLMLITTHITPMIKVTYRKAFNLMPDGTVFFDVTPFSGGAWLLDAELIVKHEGKVLFDSSFSHNATDLFELVRLNVDPEIFNSYMETNNEVRVAQTLLPMQKT